MPSFMQLYEESAPMDVKLLAIETKTSTFYYIFLALFLSLFFVVEGWFEQNKPRCGHPSGVIVILGILFSAIIWQISNNFTAGLDISEAEKL